MFLKCLLVSYCSVSRCLTNVFASVQTHRLTMTLSSFCQCPITASLHVLQQRLPLSHFIVYILHQCLAVSYYSASLCLTEVFANVLLQCLLCPTKLFASVSLQCLFSSYRIACQFPIAVSLSVLLQCLPVSYFSVSLCPTAVFARFLLQCLPMSYNNACHCPITVSFCVPQQCYPVS